MYNTIILSTFLVSWSLERIYYYYYEKRNTNTINKIDNSQSLL